ncbi:MAG TPA: hypothetical protein DD435_11025 [Cyanobacteria bacterium UBA8530]|nr:hypothetical protein [Cyanobacteria bacterium UBA8530]
MRTKKHIGKAVRGASLLFLLVFCLPAEASTVAFEDQGVLEKSRWQLNSIFFLFPNTQKVEEGRIAPLEARDAGFLGQFAQEFRYGLTERVMLRTTLPLSFLREEKNSSGGLGDSEAYCKVLFWGEEDSTFQAAFGTQFMAPTAFPGRFGINGGFNFTPSLMLKLDAGPGIFNALLGYSRALEREEEGKRIHPSDCRFVGCAWNSDLGEKFNLALEALWSDSLGSSTDGMLDQGSKSQSLTVGPGLSWAIAPDQDLMASLQVPLIRSGDLPLSQPFSLLLQFSRNL